MDTCVCSLPLPARPFNPFHHRARFLWYHWLTVPILGLLVFPVRLLLLILCLAGAFLTSFVTQLIGGRAVAPLSPWRRFVADYILLSFGRAGAFVGGFYYVDIKGRRADVSEAPIVVGAPHTSLIDTAAFFCLRPMLAPVSKAPRNFFYNVMLPTGEALVVHRDSREMRARAADELMKRARSGGRYAQLLTFPEGTCTNGGALIGFRAGAFAPGVPVQPLIVRHRDPLQLQCWACDGLSMFHMIFRCGARTHCKLQLEFLPVYRPSPEERADAQLYANNVRDLMARHANLPVSDQSHTDVLIFKAARKRGLPRLGFPLSGLRRFLRRLQPIPSSPDDVGAAAAAIRLLLARGGGLAPGPARLRCPHELAADFASASDGEGDGDDGLQTPGGGAALEPCIRLVFDIFDRTSSGRIDPRQLYIAAALLRWPNSAEETLRYAMDRMTDTSGSSKASDSGSAASANHSDRQQMTSPAAMETALYGLVGMTPDLCQSVLQSAPFVDGLASADSCVRHAMKFKPVENLLRLCGDLSDLMY